MPVETDNAAVVAALVDQLIADHQHLGVQRLTAELDQAVVDLAGSVTREALPEMAMRLVLYRLHTTDSPGDHPPTSVRLPQPVSRYA